MGFIGLGTMGGRMVERLVAGGYTPLVYDLVPTLVARLVAHGARAAGSLGEVAQESELLLSSLPMPADVVAVYLGDERSGGEGGGERSGGEGGAWPQLRAGQVCVDLSTIDPTTAQRVAARLAARGVAFLDAPVSGGPAGVTAGTLTVMAGGDGAALERVRPVLETFAGRIVHVGSVGAGSTIKLANQLLVGANTIAALEAVTFAQRAGIVPELALEVLSASAGDSVMLRRTVRDFLLTGDYTPAFAMRLLLKDLRLYVAEAERLHTATPAGAPTRTLYEEGVGAGLEPLDYAAIVRLIAPDASSRA